VREHARAGDLRVADAMTQGPLVIPHTATVAEVVERYMRPNRFAAFPIADACGRTVGLMTVRRMAELPRESWSATPVVAAAATPAEIVECAPQDRLHDVAARLQSSPDRRALVVERGRLVGILTPSDVARAIGRAELLGQASGAGEPGRGRAPGETSTGIA